MQFQLLLLILLLKNAKSNLAIYVKKKFEYEITNLSLNKHQNFIIRVFQDI